MITVVINSIAYDVLQGYSVKKSVTEQLHSALVSFNYRGSKPAIKKYDIAKFENEDWLVSSVNTVWVGGGLYRCTLVLVELTFILEKSILSPCSFTNANDTLKMQIEKLFYKVETLKVGETPRFSLSSAFNSFLTGLAGEDFRFDERVTLREALDEMISAYGIRAYVEELNSEYSQVVIGYLDLNRKSNDVKTISGNIVAEEEVDSAEFYADEFDVKLENVYSKKKLVIQNDWQTLKPVEIGELEDTNLKIVTEMPIEEVISIKIKFWCSLFTYDEFVDGVEIPVNNVPVWLDITDLFVEQELFNAMSLDQQSSAIPYQRGATQISALVTYQPSFITYLKLDNYINAHSLEAIENYMSDNNIEYNSIKQHHISLGNDFDETLFKVDYVPILSIKFKQSKDKLNVDKKITSVINQTDRSVDIYRQSSSLRTLANLTGNIEKTKEVTVANVEDLLQLGDRVEDNFSLVALEYFRFKNFVRGVYTFAQNYEANTSARLSRERRLYNIPIDNLVNRPVLIKDNLLISTSSITHVAGAALSIDSVKLLVASINNKNHYIDRLLLKGRASGGVDYPTGTYYSIAFTGKPFGKSLVWQARTQDNFSVGLSTGKQVIGGREVHLNRYVNDLGELNVLSLVFINTNTDSMTFTNQLTIGNSLPLISSSLLSQYTKWQYSFTLERQVLKDRLETLEIIYQLEAKAIDDKLVIGNYLFEYMNLLPNKETASLRIWVSTDEVYNNNDVENCKGILTSGSYTPTVDELRIYTNYPDLINVKSWAIGTTDGKLLLAVNNNNQNINSIHFGISRNI